MTVLDNSFEKVNGMIDTSALPDGAVPSKPPKHTQATGKRRSNWRIIDALERDVNNITRSRDRWRFIAIAVLVVTGIPAATKVIAWLWVTLT